MSVWVFLVTFMAGSLVVESKVSDFPDEMTCKMFGQVFIMQTMQNGSVVVAADCVEEKPA